MQRTHYFSPFEWKGFWITTWVAFAVYFFTLAPNVGLEDSGEFLTASYNFGVPHPPGYPSWTILAFLFEQIPFGNAAWRVNLMSAVFGALAAGMLSLITCKFAGRLLKLERFKDFTLEGISKESSALMVGVTSGLIFAFIDTMWSQAVIAEVYTLNSFFFTSLCLLVMRWFDSPEQKRWPIYIALVFGVGITNHQTLLVSAPAFIFAMRCADRELYRRIILLAAISCGILAWQTKLYVFLGAFAVFFLFDFINLTLQSKKPFGMGSLVSTVFSLMCGAATLIVFSQGRPFSEWNTAAFWVEPRGFWFFICSFLFFVWVCLLVIDAVARKEFDKPTIVFGLSFLVFILGVSLYLYMPLSAFTNPPMNWGHVQTIEEFHHQYEYDGPRGG